MRQEMIQSGLPFPAIGCPVMDIRRNYYIWNYLSSKLLNYLYTILQIYICYTFLNVSAIRPFPGMFLSCDPL